MSDILFIHDVYARAEQAKAKNQEIDFNSEAQTERVVIRAMGRDPRMLAIIPQHNEKIAKAFRDAGFLTVAMNGNRHNELPRLIDQEIDLLDLHKPKRCIFVTGDPLFNMLARQAVRNHAEVSIWWPEALPHELSRPEYEFRRLQDVIPNSEIKIAKVVIYLDYENLHIGLEHMGVTPNPKTLIEIVRKMTTDLGKVVELHAYADWEQLAQSASVNIQRELAILGVKTHYQIGRHGKNTADMEIVHDVQSRVERPADATDAVDVIVLGTRDRDFATSVKHAQNQGKRVCILALREGISRDLVDLVKEDVRYLDEHFKQPVQIKPRTTNNEQFTLAMRTVAYLFQHQYRWTYINKLAAAVAPGGTGVEKVRQAQAQGLFKAGPADKPNSVTLDLSHPDTYLAWWLYERLDYYLNKRKMPFVDTNFLKRGMAEDRQMQAFGIGQTWPEVKKELERAAATGCIAKKWQTHNKDANKQIETWWLAGEEAIKQDAHPNTEVEESVNLTTVPSAGEKGQPRDVINTGGGLIIHGDVNIGTGNVVGRDNNSSASSNLLIQSE